MPDKPRPRKQVKLFGDANETHIIINGVTVKALLDTGATVSTISKSLFLRLGLELHTLDKIVPIECADGQQLP